MIAQSPTVSALQQHLDVLDTYLERWDALFATAPCDASIFDGFPADGHWPFERLRMFATLHDRWLPFILCRSQQYGSVQSVLALSDKVFDALVRENPSGSWLNGGFGHDFPFDEALSCQANDLSYRFAYVPGYSYTSDTGMSYNGSYGYGGVSETTTVQDEVVVEMAESIAH